MTDEQLEELMQRARAGDANALAKVDGWIVEVIGAICATPPLLDGQTPGG